MLPTISDVAKGKKKTDRHKPRRIVGIPEALAKALEEIGEEQFNSLAEQVKIACREYLDRKGRLPRVGGKGKPKDEGG